MPKLIYMAHVRFPTEKAHGLQIAQNCEAFANTGYDVELWVSRRFNTPEMRQITDSHAHYGVASNFRIRRIPCLDVYPLAGGNPKLEFIAFYIQIVTFIGFVLLRLLFNRADIYYSRAEQILLPLSWIFPAQKLAYEAHLFSPSRLGQWLQSQIVRRVGSTIAITPRLRDDLISERGADPTRVLVAHDGVRAERFANLPTSSQAREHIGWSQAAFIVGFVGRLHMINQDKGISTLIDALAQLDNVSLALVGGPDEMAEAYRQQWHKLSLAPERFLYAGQVPPDQVPRYLRAFDVCAMPHPFTKQFAFYTSPLKLFEYMAAERAIVASDLPAWADVVAHEQHALLVPPTDVDALAAAIAQLQADTPLREQLGKAAHQRVLEHYTWSARAENILAFINRRLD